MSCEGWKYNAILEHGIEIIDGDRGSNYPKNDEFFKSGYCLFLNTGNVSKRGLVFDNLAFISKNKDELLRKGKIQRNDIVLTTRGTVGNIGYYSKDVPYDHIRINSGMVIIRPVKVDGQFLFHLLASNEIQNELKTLASGSAQPQLPIKDLKKLNLLLPPLPEQRAIARILSSLDDKIELNNRMNKTLEEIAQTIFKRWFVDFEFPDENGNPYKSSGGKMVESELGMIPEGWRVGTAKHLLLRKGKSFTPSSNNKEIKYIGLEHMPQKSISLNSWGNSSDVTSTKSYFEKGDILFGKLRPYFHKVGIAPVDGICSTDILVLNSVNKDFYGYAVCLVSSTEYVKFADSASEGTKMPRAKWSHMETYSIVIPIVEISKMFNNIVIPMYAKIIENIHATNTLSQLRDTLIPRLMSGEIRINI